MQRPPAASLSSVAPERPRTTSPSNVTKKRQPAAATPSPAAATPFSRCRYAPARCRHAPARYHEAQARHRHEAQARTAPTILRAAARQLEMQGSVARTFKRAAESRPEATKIAYCAKAREFQEWCVARDPTDPGGTVSGRALHLFLETEVVGRKSRAKGDVEGTIGISTIKQYTNAITVRKLEFADMQSLALSNEGAHYLFGTGTSRASLSGGRMVVRFEMDNAAPEAVKRLEERRLKLGKSLDYIAKNTADFLAGH
ncbi:hypothetical protein SPRG_05480 [Saprolegnia parasitica CBS 223.65]|uniref:Uncharacterized protein n=1 Tax=Saprolegnia parasitica (strain CBS 223.65) TaxID=695850 RepID=A0A067CG82_SAPPC|nr:hypothetical protein SPRG_05480 [Saprolegnia parasitica CBS 223.65]KDO29523.1 hypothetical protein SPRG_05480 [Saprolegnia parasitica CBS 223.65]|eukprot:XP_012199589.1 hypothetical protein SPRG_05480 [Saprolegnia parasitica CBS 223.65]